MAFAWLDDSGVVGALMLDFVVGFLGVLAVGLDLLDGGVVRAFLRLIAAAAV